MDTSETLTGKRERALVEGAMDSDVPSNLAEKKCRLGNLHLACVMEKNVAKENAQWWPSDMGGKIDTQTRKDPGSSSVIDGWPVLSARVTDECNRISAQDLTRMAKRRGLAAWGQIKVFPPAIMGTQSQEMVNTRLALSWKKVAGVKTVKARSVATGNQDPGPRTGNVDIAGCVSQRSSRLQLISPAALQKWPLRSLDIKNACPQADGFDREVYLRASCEWAPKDGRRVWKLRAPAYGLNDAPVAFHRPLPKNLVDSA